ncbi:MAG: branched-chain amino acid ABC transporter permease [Hyphomicrobium sp.]|nr:branched-chain amino acid ABC transporter permease [Hyphomicrobium sp.]
MTAIDTYASLGPRTSFASLAYPLGIIAVAYGVIPFVANDYVFDAILAPFLALSLAAVGLNILTGYAGQVSLGSAAFMAVGAYAAFNFDLRLDGLPLPLTLVLAGLTAAVVGVFFGLPSLRLKGFYLAVSTLAAQFFVQWALTKFGWFSNNNSSGVIDAPSLGFLGFTFNGPQGRYLFSVSVVLLLTFFAWINVLRTKLLAFAISSFIIGIAGVLWAFAYLKTVEPHGFNLDRSFQILFIIIIGGLASIRGAFFGAALIVVCPLILSRVGGTLFGDLFDSGVLDMSQRIVIGALIVAFLIAEPDGLVALWDRLKKRLTQRAGSES